VRIKKMELVVNGLKIFYKAKKGGNPASGLRVRF